MQLFYAPNITIPLFTLCEQESQHCVKVLRMGVGEHITLTDGRGTLFTARITEPNPKNCVVEVLSRIDEFEKRCYNLVMAVAPTKNTDRFEWFLEKATEVGVDRVIPIDCRHSERRVLKTERAQKVITSAIKQSLKAYHPVLNQMTSVREVITMPFDGVKLIAHCEKARVHRRLIGELVKKGDDVLILIGPEGDFSTEEINFAVENGFREVSLGDARLRSETAALAATMFVSFINL